MIIRRRRVRVEIEHRTLRLSHAAGEAPEPANQARAADESSTPDELQCAVPAEKPMVTTASPVRHEGLLTENKHVQN